MSRHHVYPTLKPANPSCEYRRRQPIREDEKIITKEEKERRQKFPAYLLRSCLEATVTELGGSVNELELYLLQRRTLGVDQERLAQSEHTLFNPRCGALDHDPVLVNETVVGETTQRSDSLLGKIVLGGTAVLVASLADTVDLLVHFGTVVITVLTGTRDRVHDTGRMPCTNTSNLTQTFVGLTGELLGTPTSGDTLETVTLGNTDNIDHFVLFEDGVNVDGLLKVLFGPVDLVGHGSTVQLDLHNVGLLLAELDLADLGVRNDTDDLAVLLDALKLLGDGLGPFGVLLGVLGESLLLGTVPVLVEAALQFIAKVLGPDGSQRTKTARSLDVTDNTDNDHGRSLDDANGLDDFLLVHLCRAINSQMLPHKKAT